MENKLRALMEATAQRFSLPSISLSVRHKGRDYHLAHGLANVSANVAATPDTYYCIGSSTKAFVATALNILAMEGRIDLDKPVREVLPWFKLYDPYMTDHLTPRDALCHRSGLPRHDLTWLNTPDRTTRQLVEALAWLPPAFEPRYRMHYQNHMFILATLLVETLTEMPWGQFVSQRIWQPLGMGSTYASGNLISDDDPRKAKPYALKDGAAVQVPYNYAVNVGGAGSIYSTTRDMLKWLSFRIQGNDAVLDNARLEDMHSPQMIIKPGEMSPISFPEVEFFSYGLAWFVESYRGVKAVHHGGTINGFKSEQLFLPDKDIAVSALCNLNGTQAVTALPYKVVDLLLGLEDADWDNRCFEAGAAMMGEILGKSAAKVKAAQAKATSCSDLSPYEGTFSHPAYGSITFSAKDDSLKAAFIGGETGLIYAGGDAFVLLDEGHGMAFPAEFERDADNRVCAVSIPLEEMVSHIPARFLRI